MDTWLRTNALLICVLLLCARTGRAAHGVPTVPANAMLRSNTLKQRLCGHGLVGFAIAVR